MKAFGGFKAEKSAAREQLPVGGYVAKILNAEIVEYNGRNGPFQKFEIFFDIAEGPYAEFFKKDFEAQSGEDKKWAGKLSLYLPKDDGSEKDGWTKRTFNHTIWCVEDANPNYHWNWDERTLKGKMVGVLFRSEEWEWDGNTGWKTKCCAFAAIGDIRDGKFKMPKDKPLKNKAPISAIPETREEAYTGSLPWD